MNELLYAISNSITDFLQTASIVAVALTITAGLIIKIGRLRTAVYRHLIWLYCLIGIVIVPLLWLYGPKLTLAILPPQAEQNSMTQPFETIASPATQLAVEPEPVWMKDEPVNESPITPQAAEFATELRPFPFKPVIAAVWLCGLVLMLLRLTVGWLQLQRFSHRTVRISDEQSLAIPHPNTAQLRVSSDVISPVCYGLLRPVILLPCDSMEKGDWQELQMILAHEQAHIERRDCLTNLFQRLVKAVFFFHPCIWWTSRQLTQQREQICDNHVLTAGDTVEAYTALLVDVAEKWTAAPYLRTVALTEGSLLQRIRTLLDPQQHRLTRLTLTSIIASILMATVLISLCTAIRLEPKPNADPVQSDKLDSLLSLEWSVETGENVHIAL